MPIKTIDDIDIQKYFDEKDFEYQKHLTDSLDKLMQDFDQDIINQIILWKVNRHAALSEGAFDLLNRIKGTETKIDERLTIDIIQELLCISGIRLPMASTILRFKNPNIYQILDQRAFRVLRGKAYKASTDIAEQAKLYIEYLSDLKKTCLEKGMPFYRADRILYLADKKENKDVSLSGRPKEL